VTFRNPDRFTTDSHVRIGQDTVVYPFAVLEGETVIGSDCVVGPGAHLKNCRVGNGVEIKTGTVAEDSIVGDGAAVGPYAHLRGGTVLGQPPGHGVPHPLAGLKLPSGVRAAQPQTADFKLAAA